MALLTSSSSVERRLVRTKEAGACYREGMTPSVEEPGPQDTGDATVCKDSA